MLPSARIQCPYCGEPLEILIDDSEGAHRYIEDCQVCCRPIEVGVEVDEEGAARVWASTGDEA